MIQFIRCSLLTSRSPSSLPPLLFRVRYDSYDSVYVCLDPGEQVRLLSRITLENDRSYLWNSPSLRRSLRSLLTSKVQPVLDYFLSCCHSFLLILRSCITPKLKLAVEILEHIFDAIYLIPKKATNYRLWRSASRFASQTLTWPSAHRSLDFLCIRVNLSKSRSRLLEPRPRRRKA